MNYKFDPVTQYQGVVSVCNHMLTEEYTAVDDVSKEEAQRREVLVATELIAATEILAPVTCLIAVFATDLGDDGVRKRHMYLLGLPKSSPVIKLFEGGLAHDIIFSNEEPDRGRNFYFFWPASDHGDLLSVRSSDGKFFELRTYSQLVEEALRTASAEVLRQLMVTWLTTGCYADFVEKHR